MHSAHHQTYQAQGNKLLITLPKDMAGKRVEVTVQLAEEPENTQPLLVAAEQALAQDWLNQDEDAAWESL